MIETTGGRPCVIVTNRFLFLQVHCTPALDAVTETPKHTTLRDELLDVLKDFHSSLPSEGPKTPSTETAPNLPPLANDRISIMHFPAAPALGSVNGSTHNLMVPGVIHQGPLGLNIQIPESSSSLTQAPGPAGNPIPFSVPPPPIAETGPSSAPAAPDQQSSPIAIPPASSRSPDPALLKIEPIGLQHNAKQELIRLLSDLRMTPAASPDQPPVAPSQNQMLANGPATRPAVDALPSSSLQPPKVAPPVLGPNQTPLDYLLSSSFPMHHLKSIPGYSSPSTNANTLPTVDRQQPTSAKPRPNLEFVKYLLTLPRYQQALNDLVKAQSSIQT